MEITQRQLTQGLSLIDLAHVLFASSLQELDRPTAAQVREAVSAALCNCGGDCPAYCSACTAYVAQEAGDHPDRYQRRMRWALAAVRQAYPPACLRPAMRLAS
jgi:hypothetical protein